MENKRDDVLNAIQQIAEHDLKYNYIKNIVEGVEEKEIKEEQLLGELKKTGEIKIPYASHVELGKLYKNNKIDLDNSNGRFPLMGMIYKALWGWNYVKADIELENFKVTPLFDEVLFGGDWIYSLGWCRYDDEESYKVRGCIGTFTLVPAYFNGRGHANKDWKEALKILSKEDWKIAEWTKEKVSPFKCANYRKYINTMFLWDFDEHESGTNNIKNCRIMRRSYFMATMLEIAVGFKGVEIDASDFKEEWPGWNVSNLYKYIVKNVFLVDEKYSGYGAVINKIVEIVDVMTENKALEQPDSNLLKEVMEKCRKEIDEIKV